MSSLFGVLGGIVGGVASGVVGAASGVVGGVVSVVSYALSDEGDHLDEQDLNIYEQRAKVDQVLFFFEREFDRYEPYVEDAARLEALRVDYYNCVNAVDFQCEVIAQLVDELLEIRGQMRSSGLPAGVTANGPLRPEAVLAAVEAARKEACIRLAHIRLDIGERRSKRLAKDRERRALHAALSPLISEAKMRRFLEEQASAQREAEEVASAASRATAAAAAARERPAGGRRGAEDDEPDVRSSEMEAHQSAKTMSRRRYKHYSDAELTALLREKDD